MNSLIEKNKNWLKFYSTTSRILGWIMMLLALVSFFSLVRISWTLGWGTLEERRILLLSLGAVIEKIFGWLPVSVILLGIGQLLRYIYDDEYKVPWLLRNGAKVLYLFAVMEGMRPFIFYFYHNMMHMNLQVRVITSICFLFANVLIFIGMADILKRVLPIIKEHKSLV